MIDLWDPRHTFVEDDAKVLHGVFPGNKAVIDAKFWWNFSMSVDEADGFRFVLI